MSMPRRLLSTVYRPVAVLLAGSPPASASSEQVEVTTMSGATGIAASAQVTTPAGTDSAARSALTGSAPC